MNLFAWPYIVWYVLICVAGLLSLVDITLFIVKQHKDKQVVKFYASGERMPNTRYDVERIMRDLEQHTTIDGDTIKAYSITDERDRYTVTVDFGEEVLPFSFPKSK